MATVNHRVINTNGINMHMAEQGQGPLVILCHGFPELWYSWRHQLPALAEAGYRVLAPDMRGCGRSGIPDDVAAYSMLHLVGDVVGLLDRLDLESVVLVGHDWAAETVWQCAKAHPQRVSGVVALSVPYKPRAPEPPSVL